MTEEHIHGYYVTDYLDSDMGVVGLECDCGSYRRGAMTQKEYDNWKDCYVNHWSGPLLFCPDANTEKADEDLRIDAAALGIVL